MDISPDRHLYTPAELSDLAKEAELSREKVGHKLSSLRGRVSGWLFGKMKHVPRWASRHIEAHRHLEKAVNEMIIGGHIDQIPPETIASLRRSKKVMGELAKKVEQSVFARALLPGEEGKLDDPSLVLRLDQTRALSPSSLHDWELNFGLLYSTYLRTEDEDIRFYIRFLMINYLAKAAYLNVNTSTPIEGPATLAYQNMLQLVPNHKSSHG